MTYVPPCSGDVVREELSDNASIVFGFGASALERKVEFDAEVDAMFSLEGGQVKKMAIHGLERGWSFKEAGRGIVERGVQHACTVATEQLACSAATAEEAAGEEDVGVPD